MMKAVNAIIELECVDLTSSSVVVEWSWISTDQGELAWRSLPSAAPQAQTNLETIAGSCTFGSLCGVGGTFHFGDIDFDHLHHRFHGTPSAVRIGVSD